MSVAAPPRPPRSDLPHDRDAREALEALIKEARRRARRRRQRQAAASVLAAAVAVGAFVAFRGGGGVSPAEPVADGSQPTPYAQAPTGLVKDGELTIIDFAETADPNLYGAPRGWYGLSTVGRDGRLQPLVRCPDELDWCGWVVSADWAGDGRHLAISVTTLRTPNPNGLHVLDVSTGIDHHLGQVWLARDLDWGPGERLAYVDRGVITLINADGTGRTTLRTGTQGRDSSPSWSPDGLWLAYATDAADADAARIYRIRADGSTRELLATRAAAPAWSPLGTAIAYRSDCGIKLVTPEGRDVTPPSPPFKCDAIGVRGTPSWSPDGARIGIGANPRQDFPGGTFVMNGDGTNLVRLTRRASGGAFAQPRPAWRPSTPRN